MTFSLSAKAVASVRNTSPNQTWAFVLSSLRKNAIVVDAMISFDSARRAARAVGGCVRIGHVSNGRAETL